jgi:hypothetical protein
MSIPQCSSAMPTRATSTRQPHTTRATAASLLGQPAARFEREPTCTDRCRWKIAVLLTAVCRRLFSRRGVLRKECASTASNGRFMRTLSLPMSLSSHDLAKMGSMRPDIAAVESSRRACPHCGQPMRGEAADGRCRMRQELEAERVAQSETRRADCGERYGSAPTSSTRRPSSEYCVDPVEGHSRAREKKRLRAAKAARKRLWCSH